MNVSCRGISIINGNLNEVETIEGKGKEPLLRYNGY